MKPLSRPFSLSELVRRITTAALLATSLSSCQLLNRDKVADEPEKADALYPQPTLAQLPPEAQELNDAARVLAGLDAISDQDKHPQWRKESFWRTHRAESDVLWSEFASKRGMKVRTWAATEVADVEFVPVVFQPFGGPDFIFSHLLFPNAETYVLCGTLPCVDLPKVGDVNQSTLADTVQSVRTAMAGALKVESKNAKFEAAPRTAGLEGALPVLLALAARTGHIIESVEMMPLDDQNVSTTGPIELDPPTSEPNLVLTNRTAHPASACVISMRTGDGKAKRLFYFNQALNDEALPESAALLRYLNKQPRIVAVVNDSAHELHRPNTLRLQKYLASHAAAIVQDPSGVPHRHFNSENWAIQRYGSYSGAPGEQHEFDQPDLVAAYNDQTNRPLALPFGRGPIGQETSAALLIARPLGRDIASVPTEGEMTPLSEDAPMVTDTAAAGDLGLPTPPDGPVTESEFLKVQPSPVPSIIVSRPTAVGPTAAAAPAEPLTQPAPTDTAALKPVTPAPATGLPQ